MSLVERSTPRPQPAAAAGTGGGGLGVRLHRFTVDEYHRMREYGVFQGDNPIEMIEGHLVIKLDFGPPYDVPLGIIPVGTANDFARQVGIPADAAWPIPHADGAPV